MANVLGSIGIAAAVAIGGCAAGPSEPIPDAALPPAGPPPSAGHDLVYHDGLGVVVLVNAGLGSASPPPSDQPTRLWAWNGDAWSALDSTGPPIRNLGGVAYDAGRDVLVIHGGTYSAQLSYGDTWEWTQAGGWRRLDVPGPGIRDHTQMTYDAARGRIVLFGGQSSPSSFPRDTWTWDGVQWEAVADTGPTPRVHHAMQYDPVSQQVVLFGGYEPNVADRGDTWAWNGSAWAELLPVQPARTHGRMAFDEGVDGLVLVGGSAPEDPILVHQTDGWHPFPAAGGPGRRYLPGVAYDRRRHVLVVFGGGDPSSNALYSDTWEFDGTSWHRRDPR